MLVLSRKKNEGLVLWGNETEEIRITVVAIQGNRVRLAIEAPEEVAVHRGEVAAALKREGRRFIRRRQ